MGGARRAARAGEVKAANPRPIRGWRAAIGRFSGAIAAPPRVQNETWIAKSHRPFCAGEARGSAWRPPPATKAISSAEVYFDVIGLPPTPEEVQAFVNDRAPNAYEQLVDRLLASPRYGEHFARAWLDVVRYAGPRVLNTTSRCPMRGGSATT